jgi:hypothetical protein
MKTTIATLIFLLYSTFVSAQKLTQDVFIGTWTVINSKLLQEVPMEFDDDGKEKMEEMRKGFLSTQFTFGENGDFKVNFPPTIPDFMKELEFLNNKKWKIGDDRMISIGSEEDGYSLMSIIVAEKSGKKFFILHESPFLLEVAKK